MSFCEEKTLEVRVMRWDWDPIVSSFIVVVKQSCNSLWAMEEERDKAIRKATNNNAPLKKKIK